MMTDTVFCIRFFYDNSYEKLLPTIPEAQFGEKPYFMGFTDHTEKAAGHYVQKSTLHFGK